MGREELAPISIAGKRILRGARQALAFARGETADGFVVHVPQVKMDELLAEFDPQKHRRALELDVEPVGTETKEMECGGS